MKPVENIDILTILTRVEKKIIQNKRKRTLKKIFTVINESFGHNHSEHNRIGHNRSGFDDKFNSFGHYGGINIKTKELKM